MPFLKKRQKPSEPKEASPAPGPAQEPAPGPLPVTPGVLETPGMAEARVEPTQPLEVPQAGPLPEGTMLKERQYEIKRLVSPGTKINVYVVEADVEQRACPNCGMRSEVKDGQFCSGCGADLSQAAVTRPEYLAKESMELDTFEVESRLAKMHLQHPHMVALRDAFVQTPYGTQQRSYLVLDVADAPRLASLPVPQEPAKVREWGLQLAEVLDYLHQRRVVHHKVIADNVLVDDEGVRLTNFNVAEIIPKPAIEEQGPERFPEDVRGLVDTLHYLLTGQSQLGAVRVPPGWGRIFNRAVSKQPFKSASELAEALKTLGEEQRPPVNAILSVGKLSNVGRSRELNEDSLLVMEFVDVCESRSRPVGVFVVADGMGGHQGGEVASRQAVKTVGEKLIASVLAPAAGQSPVEPEQLADKLREAIQAANTAIKEQAKVAQSDMGTTLVMAAVQGDLAVVANVGDSRAYYVTNQSIKQISRDHSLVQSLVDAGTITPEEAKVHPRRNAIYRMLGDKAKVEIDVFTQRLNPSDRILLCSDGLNGMIDDPLIHQLIVTSPDPQTACEALVQQANQAGGLDNITAVLIQLRAV